MKHITFFLLLLIGAVQAQTFSNGDFGINQFVSGSGSGSGFPMRKLVFGTGLTATESPTGTFTLTSSGGGGSYQPLDSDLTALAALTTTSYGLGLTTLANQAALQTAIGAAVPGTASTVVLRDSTGAATVTTALYVTHSGTGNTTAILGQSGLVFANSAADGLVTLLPPTLATDDDWQVELPAASGTIALVETLPDFSGATAEGLTTLELIENEEGDFDSDFLLGWDASAAKVAKMAIGSGLQFSGGSELQVSASLISLGTLPVTRGGTGYSPGSFSNAFHGAPLIGDADNDRFAPLVPGTVGQVLGLVSDGTYGEAAAWVDLPAGGVALGDSPTWTGTHTFASGVVNVYDKLTLKTTGQAGDATAFEVITDPNNPAVRALRILPPANGGRVYIGKSGQAAYALNLQYCSSIEWCPPVSVTANGIVLGSNTATSISRSADGTQIGANHPGDGGLTIYHAASYASIAASQLVARIHRTSGISFYGTNTSATSYERVSMAYDSGNTCYYIDTQKGAAGGTARAFEIRTDGTTRVRVSAAGEIFLTLPTSAGTTGSLWNDGGTVKVAP